MLREYLYFLSAAFLRRMSLIHSSFHHGTGFLCCLTLAVFREGVQFEIVPVITFIKKLYLPMVLSESNEGSRNFENDIGSS